jgi:DNA-binding LacI/PurR family transcriptional regulator/DNA-binding transcriptional regulator YhcF (GntR family)
MMPAQKVSKPKYLQIAQRLRREIVSGRLSQGDRLESLAEMRTRYGVTRPTVEKAHSILEREGLIERVQGRGTFVRGVTKGAASGTGGARGSGSAAASVLSSMVAVLTIQGRTSHSQQAGWAEFIGLGASRALRDEGLHTLSLSPEGLGGGGLQRLLEGRPRGVVITDLLANNNPSAFARPLIQSEVPVVVYGADPALEGFDRVTSDHEDGSYHLARWLLSQGRRRIALLWPTVRAGYWFAQREAGLRRALAEAGVEEAPPVAVPTPDRDSEGYEDAAEFESHTRQIVGYLAERLTGPNALDALMVHTDNDCFAVAAACRMCGREPGRDVAIVGYDNYWAEAPNRRWENTAPLATVDKRNLDMGAEMVRLLLERTTGQLPDEPQCRAVKPRLVVTQPQT